MSFPTLNLGIELNQGDDFNLVIQISDPSGEPIDISAYTFSGEMKVNTDPVIDPVAIFDFTILDQTLHKGQVQWSLSAEDSADIPVSLSDAERKKRLTTPYVFDVKMTSPDTLISRIIQGIVYVSPQVFA